MSTVTCCICFARKTRMYSIDVLRENKLLELYEKLTTSKIDLIDKGPTTICSTCISKLQRCHRLSNMARRVLSISKEISKAGINVKNSNITALSLGGMCVLSVSSTTILTNLSPTDESSSEMIRQQVSVKDEPTDEAENLMTNEQRNLEDDAVDDSLVNIKHTKRHKSNILKENSKYYYCNDCNRKCSSKSMLVIHLRMHTGERPYTCDQCDKAFTQVGHLKRHEQIHIVKTDTDTREKKRKSYVCKQCGKTFFSKGGLRIHNTRTHVGDKPFACNKCYNSYTFASDLKRHMQIHSGEKPHVCGQCNKSFALGNDLRNHFRIHTGEKPYACNQCNKTYCTNSHLKRHMRKHTEQKPYSCHQCDATFTTAQSVKYHVMATHTKEKPCACTQCGKTFINSSSLKQHIRTHTGEKPYTCNACYKKFTQSSSLKCHINRYTEDKPYDCVKCDRSFTQACHSETHVDDKLHACHQCGKRYTQAYTLKQHIERTHAEDTIYYECNQCNKSYSQKSHLKRHQLIHNA